MIVLGFQGIGKSTLSAKSNKYIDLESMNFWVDGIRADDWYKVYCNIAEHLSQQGYVVLIAAHKVVRDRLAQYSNEDIVLVFPSINLKQKWVERLESRYNKSGLDKDYKTLLCTKGRRYEENIDEFINDNRYKHIIITDMEYDLEKLLECDI